MPSSPLSSTSSSSSSTSSSSQQQQSRPPGSTNMFVNAWSRFHDGHERLKNAVHSYWRQNTFLSPRHTAGKVVMGCVYFSIPVIAAYFGVNKLVDATESAAHEQRVRGSNNNNGNGNSNSNSSDNSNNSSAMIGGTEEAQSIGTVGAGGWGGGVRLAGNDRVTQDVNRINLERFMRKQRKLKEKREREEAAAAAAAAAQD